MARKKFSCDFETTTDIDDCRVWAYGYMEIGNKKNYKIGNNIEDFMEWVETVKATLYFHNLRFDGEFIVNWLLKNGYKHSTSGKEKTFNTIISDMGQWYMIDICYGYTKPKGKTKPKKLHTVIYDSLKKLPFTVKQIGKAFNLEVLKIDKEDEFYRRYRPVNHVLTDEEKAYIKNDIEVIADALEIQFNQGLNRMTSGSDSLSNYKNVIGKDYFEKYFPKLSYDEDKLIRHAYRGGFTWLNERFKEKDIDEGIVFDVNSLYPSQMYYRPLPYGLPIKFNGEYENDDEYPLYIQQIKCEFVIKENRIPTIQIKKNLNFAQNEYLKSSNGEIVELYVTNIDLKLIKEHYHLYNVEYIGGWKFRQKVGLFKDFIDKWMYIKTHSDGAIKQLAKLILNSLYGKFASNPEVKSKIPYLKEDGSCGYKIEQQDNKDPVYTPMGIFITSWARYTTITTAQKCYDRIIYCDTDSIHLTGTTIPDAISDIVDPKKLGYWKHEGTFENARFIRQKTYLENYYAKWVEVDGEKVKKMCSPDEAETRIFEVKCAGMPEKVKEQVNYNNFKVGFIAMKGKLRPKHVNGGIVLVDTPFTLKG